MRNKRFSSQNIVLCLKDNLIRVLMLSAFLVCFSFSGFSQDEAVSPESGFWLWTLLGRMHPLAVHFPIGLLFIALLLEFLIWKRKASQFKPALKPIMVVASVSAILSVVLGLVLANTDSYGSETLPIHQWTGIVTMVLALISTWFYFNANRRQAIGFLIASSIGVTIAGHFGAELTHGEDYLTSAFPSNAPVAAAGDPAFQFASLKGPLSEAQVQELNFQVRTIFAHNCYSCHGAGKVKGELRLDRKEFVFKGGKNGSILIPGHPEKSELIRRVKLPRSEKEAMPNKGKGLTKSEIELLELWIRQGAPWPAGPEKSLYRVAALAPRLPTLPPAVGTYSAPVDRFVNAYFEKKKVDWKKPVDDRVYIRRVYLDVIGLLPPADSVDAFIAESRPDKRGLLVQRLLARNHDYAQHWLTFWNDLLRNDYTGTGYITGGRFDITKWLYNSLVENKPYDQFVKQLISPDSSSQGFIKGIQWRGTINSSQSTEMQAAQNVSQVFLGLNLKCASCHDSFISDWKLDDSYAFANLFCDSTLQIHRCDKPTGRMAARRILYRELGEVDSAAPRKQRLQQLADRLVQPSDGRLYRTIVNRVWAQLFGRGMVEPVDAMDNEPWSQDLLDWLAYDFVSSGYDLKKLIYTILTSQTYQLPSVGVKEPEMLVAADYVFHGMQRKRMTAEQFADAVSGSLQPVYGDSLIVFNLLPGTVKLNIPFARAALVKNDPFLTALGRPSRETVTTSRTSQANLIQALELTNGTLFNQTMEKASEKWRSKYPEPSKLINEVYRNALGRLPGKQEHSLAMKVLGGSPSVADVQDFLWSMAMHPEFQLIY